MNHRLTRMFTHCWAIFLSLILAACGPITVNVDDLGSNADTNNNGSDVDNDEVRVAVDPTGEVVVRGPSGDLSAVEVILPAGAFDESITDAVLGIIQGEDTDFTLTTEQTLAGPVVRITLSRAGDGSKITLIKPVSVTVPFKAADTASLTIGHLAADGFEYLASQSIGDATLTGLTTSFSPFAAMMTTSASTGTTDNTGDGDGDGDSGSGGTGSSGDTTAPDTVISSSPKGTISTVMATVLYGSQDTDVASYQCRIVAPNSDPFTTCPTGEGPGEWRLTGLVTGSYTVEIRAVDSAGNVDPTPATASWSVLIDTTPPDTTIDTAAFEGGTYTPGLYVDIDFSSPDSDTAGYRCTIQGSSQVDVCSSGNWHPSLSGLADGVIVFEIRAIDGAGNLDPTPATTFVNLDGTGPLAVIGSSPPSVTTSTSAVFTFSATEPDASSQYFCAIDGGVLTTNCGTEETFTGLSEGSHTLSVRARDVIGNYGPIVMYTWTIDTAPVVTFSATPAAVAATDSGTFEFGSTATDIAGYQCQVDSGGYASCTSPFSVAGLSNGVHAFDVYATDNGALTSAVITHNWTVNVAPPSAGGWILPFGTAAANFISDIDVAVDASNNVYTATSYDAPFDFGAVTLPTPAASTRDCALLKHDQTGGFQWAVTATGDCYVRSVDVYSNGDIMVAGVFSDPALFGASESNETTFIPVDTDSFIARYRNNGNLIWVKTMNKTNLNKAVVSANDSVVTAGYYSVNAVFGPGETGELSPANNSEYVASFGSNGDFSWLVSDGTHLASGSDSPAINTDSNNNIYVALSYTGTVAPGFGTANQTYLHSGIGYVAKYNSAGMLQWAHNITSSDTPNFSPNDVAITPNDDVAFCGNFRDDEIVFTDGVSPNIQLDPLFYDFFVAMYTSAGVLTYAQTTDLSAQQVYNYCAADSLGRVHVVSSLSNGGQHVVLGPTGTVLTNTAISNVLTYIYGIDVMSDNLPVLVGLFGGGAATIDGNSVTPIGGTSDYDMLILKIDD